MFNILVLLGVIFSFTSQWLLSQASSQNQKKRISCLKIAYIIMIIHSVQAMIVNTTIGYKYPENWSFYANNLTCLWCIIMSIAGLRTIFRNNTNL